MTGQSSPTTRCFDISGLGVRFSGLPPDLSGEFDDAWRLFETPSLEDPFLDVEVRVGGEPVPPGTMTAKRMGVTYGDGSAVFSLAEGGGELSADGRLLATIAPSEPSTQIIALLNLTNPSLAWLLARRRGAAVHGACVLLGERAVLLVGQSGAGKSTWARFAAEGGARVVGDDLVLVDGSTGRAEALGTPFRPRSFPSPGPGRWPIRLLLLAQHGPAARLEPANPMLARARVLANLPWVTETVLDAPGPRAIVEALSSEVPVRTLTFRRDRSFVPLLERFLDGRGE